MARRLQAGQQSVAWAILDATPEPLRLLAGRFKVETLRHSLQLLVVPLVGSAMHQCSISTRPRGVPLNLKMRLNLMLATAWCLRLPRPGRVLARVAGVGMAKPALAALVDDAVVQAADAARRSVVPGSLKDRIITDHIVLITQKALQKRTAYLIGLRNYFGFILGCIAVGALLLRITNGFGNKKLRRDEAYTQGDFRTSKVRMKDDADKDDPEQHKPKVDPNRL